MYIYEYMNYKGYPYQSAIAVADNEEEALDIIIKATDDNYGWELEGKHEYKKGIITWGDADC
ncbi:hypothetical protein EJM73_19575 [Clostridium botulinum]|uniref:hypothetical protein n=1 Tax=Clostridium botulinum TaxID=1491 RepID=UPI0013754533|nr:hypothetical protein [Clostridium botulinum]NCI22147.1 hypothetical protein [Clostridium botulinum]NCI37813.1 hypothetical protein [Clostridium botulinum]NCI74459.1 hypothetical protein [Clostridium botulinum]NDI40934.1 hypothetical protein [Clostridium botulinum]NFA13560.1 hypothetical protein [Clostridium botulinum]